MTMIEHRARGNFAPGMIRTGPHYRRSDLGGTNLPFLRLSFSLPSFSLFLSLAVLSSRSVAVYSLPPLYSSSFILLHPRLAFLHSRYSLDGLALFLSSSFRLSFSLFLVLHKLCMSSMYIIYTDLAPEHRAAANAGCRIAGKVRGLQFSSSRRSAYIIGRSGYSACAIHPAEATGTFAPGYKRDRSRT